MESLAVSPMFDYWKPIYNDYDPPEDGEKIMIWDMITGFVTVGTYDEGGTVEQINEAGMYTLNDNCWYQRSPYIARGGGYGHIIND